MARFTYTARDRSGKTVAADLDAPSRKDALRLLATRGLQVMTVDESAPTATGLPTHTVRVAVPPTGCAVEVSAPC